MKISAKQYAKTLLFIKTEDVDDIKKREKISRLAKIIMKNKDKNKISLIERALDAEKEKVAKKKKVIMFSAVRLNDEEKNKFVSRISDKINCNQKDILVENVVDRNLIGGVVVKIGNEVFDLSVKAKINKISAQIT